MIRLLLPCTKLTILTLARHYNESVWDIDPVTATGGRPVGLCWFSPDCNILARQKVESQLIKYPRGLAWVCPEMGGNSAATCDNAAGKC